MLCKSAELNSMPESKSFGLRFPGLGLPSLPVWGAYGLKGWQRSSRWDGWRVSGEAHLQTPIITPPDPCARQHECKHLVPIAEKPGCLSVYCLESFFEENKSTGTTAEPVLTGCCLFFPLIRTELYPKAVRRVWTSNSKRTGLLCRNGAALQRLLSQCRVRRRHRERGGDVPRACHAAVGPGRQVWPQLLPVQPVQLGPHPHRHGAREQVGQRERWVPFWLCDGGVQGFGVDGRRRLVLLPLFFPPGLPSLSSFCLSFCF